MAEVIPAAVVAVAIAGGWGPFAWWLVTLGYLPGGDTASGQYWGHIIVILTAAIIAVALVWWGPWTGGTRDGGRRIAALVAPTDIAARVWVWIAVVGIASVGFALLWNNEPWWWPLPEIGEAGTPAVTGN